MPDPLAELTIVVVTWRNAADVPALVAALAPARAAGAELVVYNASTDDTAALVRRLVPGATLVVNAVIAVSRRVRTRGSPRARGRSCCS